LGKREKIENWMGFVPWPGKNGLSWTDEFFERTSKKTL
jgi:hypothetical protein